MIYVFTGSNKIGSRLIQWGRETDMSHMLVAKRAEWDSPVVESTLFTGVRQTTLRKAIKGKRVVAALRLKNLTKGELDALFFNVQKLVGEHYDWQGIAFWAVAIFWCVKVLNVDLPPENKWADKEDFYCSELLFANEDFLKLHVNINKYGQQMVDPKRAAEILSFSNKVELVDLELELKFNEA